MVTKHIKMKLGTWATDNCKWRKTYKMVWNFFYFMNFPKYICLLSSAPLKSGPFSTETSTYICIDIHKFLDFWWSVKVAPDPKFSNLQAILPWFYLHRSMLKASAEATTSLPSFLQKSRELKSDYKRHSHIIRQHFANY